jgi:predicted metalloprotease with PDZ domain
MFILLLVFLVSCQKKELSDIHYYISQVERDSVTLLKVRLEMEPDDRGTTKLRYDDQAWGEEDLFDAIQDVNLVSPEGSGIEINRDSSWIQVYHIGKSGPLVLEYLLKQDFSLEEQPRENYRPIVQAGYFHIFAHNFFMVPDSWAADTQSSRQVSLSWEGFPSDYVIHNSFGSQERTQQLNEISLEDFHSAIFVGGDFRLHEGDIEGNRVVLAIRGEWIPFDETEVFQVLIQTLQAQRNFWEDHSQEYFTVTLRPMDIDGGSAFQGTGLTNSFACSISNNENTELNQLIYLFNHELQHNWTGKIIQNENEEEQYWFSEGFTEYYTSKNISSYKIGGLEESFFIEQLNETIRNLYSSPVLTAPNAEINYDNFWVNQDYGKLPYYRGCVYAFLLDNWIYDKTSGDKKLDDLMREILEAARSEGQKFSHSLWLSELESYLGEEADRVFEEHIVAGVPFELETLLQNFGYDFTPNSQIFDLGFQFSSDGKSVKLVDETSEAYKGGLRGGDVVIRYSIEYGDIKRPVSLQVKRGDQKLSVSYLAVKQVSIPALLDSQHNREKISSLQ